MKTPEEDPPEALGPEDRWEYDTHKTNVYLSWSTIVGALGRMEVSKYYYYLYPTGEVRSISWSYSIKKENVSGGAATKEQAVQYLKSYIEDSIDELLAYAGVGPCLQELRDA